MSGQNERLRQVLTALPEYSAAVESFFSQAVHAITRAGNGILSQIAVEEVEAIPPMQHTLSDGQIIESGPFEASSTIEFPTDAIVEGHLAAFHEAVYETAEEFESALVPQLLRQVSDISEATGNVVDGAGRPWWESYLEALEAISIRFDEDGEPSLPTLVVNPKDAAKMRMTEPPPDFPQRLARIMEKKRNEWLARRRTRRLPREG